MTGRGASLTGGGKALETARRAVFRVVERTADHFVRVYDRLAGQRHSHSLPPAPEQGAPTILLFRCLGLVPFGERFIGTLQQSGFNVRTCLFSPRAEKRRLLGLGEMVAEACEALIVSPPEKVEVIAGSSLGGMTSLFLGALAKVPAEGRSEFIERFHAFLPPTPHRTIEALHDLSVRLQGARVILMGAPVNEIRLTRAGRQAVRAIGTIRPELFEWLERGYLRGTGTRTGLYEQLGFEPKKIADGIILGAAQTWGLHARDPFSLGANGLMQGAARLMSGTAVKLAPGELSDGVIGHHSALLGLGPDRERILWKQNHLDVMETEEAARTLLSLIH